MKKILQAAITSFFPKTCAVCGEIISESAWLCEDCRKGICRCKASSRCSACGLPKKQCVCKNRIFRFDGCIAPFVNTGLARKAMFRYKFRDYTASTRFFAEEMAECVRTEYAAISFDGVCYVPMHKRKRFRRGYQPTKRLAKALADILKLPVEYDLLSCTRYTKKPQHELDFKGRQENVRELYRATYPVEGKTLLLVDDIKTSGLTLDECSKQLLNAGASAIWCVAAMITYPKPKEKKV